MRKSKILFIAGLLSMVVFMSSPAGAITVTDPFGSFGEAGSIQPGNSPGGFTIGPGGDVFDLESALNITGLDLNGGGLGTSAILGFPGHAIPPGLDFAFMSSLSADTTDLTLTYMFTNNTGGIFPGVQFFSFLDAEIDVAINGFSDESGAALGFLGAGAADPDPDSFEIDDPGSGDIVDNILLGLLDDATSPFGPADISLALGFELGDLNPLDKATIDILVSEDLDAIGSKKLLHFGGSTFITMSGQANVEPIPEPTTIALFGIGLVGLAGAGARRKFKKEKKQLK